MSVSQFTAESRAGIVARLELSVPFKEAATRAGVRPATARGWLTRGRREESGEYHGFACDVERARALAQAQQGPLTERELKVLVSEQVRAGSVRAGRLYWQMLQSQRKPVAEDGGDELSVIDELASRRGGRAGVKGAYGS